MDVQLESPNPPVNVLEGYVTQQETRLIVTCHDRVFEKVTVTDGDKKPLFRIEGTKWGTSWSWRRKAFDANGNNHLFDFRHESVSLKNNWVIEDPSGRKLASLVHKSQVTSEHSAINATVRTITGEDVLVQMRQHDRAALMTTISTGDTPIASIQKVIDNTKARKSGVVQTVWDVRVAAGVDLSMILMLALCRAEMAHVWKQ
ncbi:hypothetical protein F5Y17DRAFT_37068 [Xylariaceae sp. FL0594]|nr:hypothetical protein F5Y17DRAFT_37068 [Xylariaceae sp. FL0594]